MTSTVEARFWDFSVRTYRKRGVADACLGLQDECGVDVNMLLFCIWTGATRGVFPDPIFDAALGFSRVWCGKVVAVLRGVRTWMKLEGCERTAVTTDRCMALREEVKQVEFKAERLQEDTLEALCADWPAPAATKIDQVQCAAANVRRYLAAARVVIDEVVLTRLEAIISAAIPEAGAAAVRASFRT